MRCPDARVARFLHAAAAGDRAVAAALVSYKLRVNGAHPAVVRDRSELLARGIFTPAFTATLRSAIRHEMFVRNGQAMVGDGAAWFDARGAVALNPS